MKLNHKYGGIKLIFRCIGKDDTLKSVLVTCLLALAATSCTKKTYITMPEPAVIIQLNGEKPMDILQEPLKDGRISWDEKKVPAIDIEGALRVTYQKVDDFYWQVKCPAQLRCNGEKAYVPISMTKQFTASNMPFANELQPVKDLQFYVAKKGDEADALLMREWMKNHKRPQPGKYLPDMALAILDIRDETILERQDKLVHMYLLSTFLAQDAESILNYPWLMRHYEKYKGYLRPAAEPEEAEHAPENKFLAAFAQHMRDLYDRYLALAVEKFPLRASTFKQLAAEFNKITHVPLVRELIIARIFEDKALELDFFSDAEFGRRYAPEHEAKVTVAGNSKIGVSLSLRDAKVDLTMHADKAEATEHGLRFFVTVEKDYFAGVAVPVSADTQDASASTAEAPVTPPSAGPEQNRNKSLAAYSYHIKLNPKVGETSKYLSVTQGIEQDIKEYKKTISDNDFANGITQESLLKLAIKYGKGEFDKKIWQYRYKVTLSKGKVYNTFLAMAKHNASNGAASDYDYSGTFPKSDVRWVQSAQDGEYSFSILFPARECGRGCGTMPARTESCFGNGSDIDVVFDPRAVRSLKDYAITVDFGEQRGECAEVLTPRDK